MGDGDVCRKSPAIPGVMVHVSCFLLLFFVMVELVSGEFVISRAYPV